jgi:hypothetical protein
LLKFWRAKAEKDGKLRYTSRHWDDAVMIMPVQRLAVHWVDGQAYVAGRRSSCHPRGAGPGR